MVLAAAVAALVLPLLLLCRQWLGWTYVRKRLVSERVEYEESGWYDGQIWEKPLTWRQRDLLVASHQVGPVLRPPSPSMAIGITLIVGREPASARLSDHTSLGITSQGPTKPP